MRCGFARSVSGSGGRSPECPATCVGWLLSEVTAGRVLAAAWLERGEQSPFIRTARRGFPRWSVEGGAMFVIGIDPHKGSHTAAVLDDTEHLVGEMRVNADRWQRDRLLRFAAPVEPRTWAVEGAGGLGSLLAQQLVAAGECVSASRSAVRLDSWRSERPPVCGASLQDTASSAAGRARRRRTETGRQRSSLRCASHRQSARGTRETHCRRRGRVAHHRHRRLRRRSDRRGVDRGTHRRRPPVPQRRSLRPLQRHRTDRSLVRTASVTPVEPAREPTVEPCVARRRDHAGLARHARPRLLRPQDPGRQDPQRSAPRAERRISNAVYQQLVADTRP